MRWFWLLILALLVSAIGLQTLRRQSAASPRQEQGSRIVINRPFDPVPAAPPAPVAAIESGPEQSQPAMTEKTADRPSKQPAEQPLDQLGSAPETPAGPIESAKDPAEASAAIDARQSSPSSEADPGAIPEPIDEPEPEPESDSDSGSTPEPIGEIVIDLPKPKPTPPDHTVNPDGSITLLDGTVIAGSGTEGDPFTLSWSLLRSVERTYQPRAGRDEFPGWIKRIDGKSVRIEGNTLLPVVSDSTSELLIMQNPWDGCCIGIPPTPFDAIEVELVHDVDFGYETVGYGVTTGTLVVDPYVVDGWVLGVYLLKDASYKSDAGSVLPDL